MEEANYLEIAQKNKKVFLGLCKTINREGIDSLLDYLEKSDFYICPASTKYHDAYYGGLLQHSINVFKEFNTLAAAYPWVNIPAETRVIVPLFHDLCKVGLYTTEKRNRKNDEGKWESYDCYTVSEKFCFGGHGSKSVYLIQSHIQLTPEEAAAINCHMGPWDGNKDVANAYEQFPVAWLLHIADEAATFINRKEDTNGT